VVSIDTLEHLPKGQRDLFVAELFRVARYGFVLCAPLGTGSHIRHLQQLLQDAKVHGDVRVYLEEHARFGLPTPEEIAVYARAYKGRLSYQGIFQKGFKPVGKLLAYPAQLVNIFKNMCMDLFVKPKKHLYANHHEQTNRFFLTVKKS
jgi:hypothetical protein